MPKNIAQHLKVMLKDIEQNPFRDFKVYPLNEERIERLINSIKETGFWDNIIGRKKGDKVEIAYGHHRVAALRRIYADKKEIEIIVRDFTDEEMLKIMGGENDEAYSCLPGATDDTVKAARDFLDKNPDIARKILSSVSPEFKRARVGAPMIAAFLGKNWTENRVKTSLERINLVESGKVDAEAIYKFPTMASADRFAEVVKEHNIKFENQKLLADEIIKEGRFGEQSQHDIAMTMGWEPRPGGPVPGDADYCNERLIRATKALNRAIREMRKFERDYTTPVFAGARITKATKADISPPTLAQFNRSVIDLGEILEKISQLLEKPK
jgi:ParB/RepB/Spo0J family partition protein